MEFSHGNHKLGKDTLIFNMGAAHDCPSRRLGLCQLDCPNKCYALKAERQYPQVLPYRRRQRGLWVTGTVRKFLASLDKAIGRKHIKYVRFNEAGDFTTQADVERLKKIARMAPHVRFYGYTARRDLSYRSLPKNLSIVGSGWRRGKMNMFTVVAKPTGKNPVCPGDCRTCNLCKSARGITIETTIH